MPFTTLSQVWSDPEFGSGPFKTSLDVVVPSSQAEMVLAAEAWEDWWNADTLLRPYLDSGLGQSFITARGVFGSAVIEEVVGPLVAPSGLDPELPGVSFRVLKLGPRPEGGRRGSMFWPGVENSAHDSHGALIGATAGDISTAVDNLRVAIEASTVGVQVVQRHIVAGDVTDTPISGFQCQSTVSYLNRRYR